MKEALRHRITQAQTPREQEVLTMGKASEEIVPTTTDEKDLATEITKTNSNKNKDIEGDPFLANLDRQFAREVAILYVEAKGTRYYFHIHNGHSSLLETEPEEPPKLSFSSHMDSKHLPQKIRGFIKAFSQSKKSAKFLRGWLLKLQKRLQEDCGIPLSCLIINDRTDFEIPWEMLDLNHDGPIGAIFPTVRWQDVPDPDDLSFEQDQKLLKFSTQHTHCRGSILAYTNTRELQATKDEVEILRKFNSDCHENIYEFLNSFEHSKSELSLLFIASHGFYREDIGEIALGEQQNNKQQISLMDLYNWEFTGFKSFPSVVFMNACHSGRLCRDEHFNVFDSEYRTGFATFFIERGAKGVVGVMGKVDDRYAACIAQNFFDEYQANPSLTVPEILRNLRAKVAQQLKNAKTELNWYLFHYTFMYVYYGHPLTKLLITSQSEAN